METLSLSVVDPNLRLFGQAGSGITVPDDDPDQTFWKDLCKFWKIFFKIVHFVLEYKMRQKSHSSPIMYT